ncbi:hypothetical protein EUGRSUZ_I00701 [Eucalyptus grandis]|uniref:Uncharacterized protein n=2 Tax=Eucalyptus grandis TaxID=71139 RepID=A0ACC3JDQ1_EUCGR|nr:hypothetical protein EUGRSUZ_I00701 [Eucalyptus grandis]
MKNKNTQAFGSLKRLILVIRLTSGLSLILQTTDGKVFILCNMSFPPKLWSTKESGCCLIGAKIKGVTLLFLICFMHWNPL